MTKMGWSVLLVIICVVAGAFFWWNSAKAPSLDQVASDSANGALNTVTDQAGTAPDTNTAATTSTNSTTGAPDASTSTATATQTAPMTATVTYDGSSFSPASVTIAQGGTVTFSDTSGQMWVASDPHPVHNGYDGTTRDQHCASGYAGAAPFDECAPGTSYTFTFTKAGSWGYHDHLNHSAVGTITVAAQ